MCFKACYTVGVFHQRTGVDQRSQNVIKYVLTNCGRDFRNNLWKNIFLDCLARLLPSRQTSITVYAMRGQPKAQTYKVAKVDIKKIN